MFSRLYVLYRSFRRRIINGPDWVYANGEKWENPLAKRKKLKKSKSKKLFSKTAQKVHNKNMPRGVMRGGIRL